MTSSKPDWLNEVMLSKALGGAKTIISFTINTAASETEHFLSTILRIKIEYKNNRPDETVHYTNFVLKTLPSDHMKSFVEDNGLLTKEINMYTSVLPLMSSIVRRQLAPKCFESCRKDVLILEDLSLENFRNCNRRKRLDFEHCVSAIELLADIHAASFILQKNHPELIDLVKKEVQFTEENPYEKDFMIDCFTVVSDELKTWIGCENVSSKLFNAKEAIWNRTVKEIMPNETDFMVLVHGDFWTNNILFQHDSDNKIKNVEAVDFQFSRWTTPAIDLHYFFLSSLMNNEYIPSLINVYLSRLNTHVHPHILTEDQLQNALHRTECLALMISISILPLMLIDPMVPLNITDTPTINVCNYNPNVQIVHAASKQTLYKSIISERLKHFENIGLL